MKMAIKCKSIEIDNGGLLFKFQRHNLSVTIENPDCKSMPGILPLKEIVRDFGKEKVLEAMEEVFGEKKTENTKEQENDTRN